MLRLTLRCWLERKAVRPTMTRAGRSSAGRTSSTAAASLTASSVSPGYHSGDVDDMDGAEGLDFMKDAVPVETLGRPLHPHSSAAARSANTQEMLSRLEHKYNLPPASPQSGAAEPRREGRAAAAAERPSARRVMSTPRRPHAAAAVDGESHGSPAPFIVPSPPQASAAPDGAEDAHRSDAHHHHSSNDGYDDAVDSGVAAASGQAAGRDDDGGEDDGGPSATTAKSADAYRFLLNHIDAEIAALQRRHSSVTTRRQSAQTRQTQRIKELFEIIEAPWSLLPTEMQPALPATGVDVYIKEQQLARQQRLGGAAANGNGSNTASGAAAAASVHDGQDKMYVLALHKNYKSMPAGRKRFYEEAAHYNAAVREEMKFQLTRGCARFEAFLDRVKECTMEMAREGQMPELPSGHAHQRFHSPRGPASHRHDGPPRTAAAAASRSAPEEDGADEAAHEAAGTAPKAIKATKGKRASRRVKDAVKAKGKSSTAVSADAPAAAEKAEASGAAARPPNTKTAKKGNGKGGRKSSATGKVSATAKAGGGSKKKAGKAAKSAKAGRGKKAATASAVEAPSSGSAAVSRSIPLPNLNQLALKKIKQMAVPPGGKKKKAAAPKTTKAKAAGGKKRKK